MACGNTSNSALTRTIITTAIDSVILPGLAQGNGTESSSRPNASLCWAILPTTWPAPKRSVRGRSRLPPVNSRERASLLQPRISSLMISATSPSCSLRSGCRGSRNQSSFSGKNFAEICQSDEWAYVYRVIGVCVVGLRTAQLLGGCAVHVLRDASLRISGRLIKKKKIPARANHDTDGDPY